MTSSTKARAEGSSSSRLTSRPVCDAPRLGRRARPPARRSTAPASAFDDRPAEAVGQRGEEPWEGARERRSERQHGMGGRCRPRARGLLRSRTDGPCAGPNRARAGRSRPRPADGEGTERIEPKKAGRTLSMLRTSGTKVARRRGGQSPVTRRRRRRRRRPTQLAHRRVDGQRPRPVSAAVPRGQPGRGRGRRGRPRAAGAPPSRRRGGTRAGSARRSGIRHRVRPPPRRTSTDSPARARVSAATRPLGPAPTHNGVDPVHRAITVAR